MGGIVMFLPIVGFLCRRIDTHPTSQDRQPDQEAFRPEFGMSASLICELRSQHPNSDQETRCSTGGKGALYKYSFLMSCGEQVIITTAES